MLAQGSNLILRYAPHMLALLDENGAAFIADELRATDEPVWSKKVLLKKDAGKPELYLHCLRMPAQKAAQAQRKKRAKANKDGRKLKKETLEYAAWVMILTSFAPAQISAAESGQI